MVGYTLGRASKLMRPLIPAAQTYRELTRLRMDEWRYISDRGANKLPSQKSVELTGKMNNMHTERRWTLHFIFVKCQQDKTIFSTAWFIDGSQRIRTRVFKP